MNSDQLCFTDGKEPELIVKARLFLVPCRYWRLLQRFCATQGCQRENATDSDAKSLGCQESYSWEGSCTTRRGKWQPVVNRPGKLTSSLLALSTQRSGNIETRPSHSFGSIRALSFLLCACSCRRGNKGRLAWYIKFVRPCDALWHSVSLLDVDDEFVPPRWPVSFEELRIEGGVYDVRVVMLSSIASVTDRFVKVSILSEGQLRIDRLFGD